jgi:hypothetical protein
VLSADYFSVPDEEIKRLESVLTIVGGRVVYGADEFASLAPSIPPVSPDWSPVGRFGGYARAAASASAQNAAAAISYASRAKGRPSPRRAPHAWGFACGCFAF